jgi:hypothetical protein
VLAATSLPFRGLLTALGPMPCSTVVLDDIDTAILQLVINFMYEGKVFCTFHDF